MLNVLMAQVVETRLPKALFLALARLHGDEKWDVGVGGRGE